MNQIYKVIEILIHYFTDFVQTSEKKSKSEIPKSPKKLPSTFILMTWTSRHKNQHK